MTELYSWQTIRVSPVGFCPLSFLESVSYLFLYSFISFIFPASSRSALHSLSLWAFVKGCVCVCVCSARQLLGCVLSLSLMSTHSSHCPYLKWPEPHQQIKRQAPPAHSAPSLSRVVYKLCNGRRGCKTTTTRQCLTVSKVYIHISIF